MSLTHAPDQSTTARHPIDESIVRQIANDSEFSVTAQQLTESLNLLQALIVTNHDPRSFFESLDSPEIFATTNDGNGYALVTPVTWWELQTYADWDNEMDMAVLEAHRREFMSTVDTPEENYTTQTLETMHPVVSHFPQAE